MKEFVSALNSYHILNFLVPGVLFALFMDKFSDADLIQENTFIGVFLYYFIGMVLSRIGSLVLEPIFKILKVFNQFDYEDYVKASNVDSQIGVLLEMSNMYRGILTMAVVLLLIFVFEPSGLLNFEGDRFTFKILLVLLIVFSFAWVKQTNYIAKRVNVLKENDFQLPEKKKKE